MRWRNRHRGPPCRPGGGKRGRWRFQYFHGTQHPAEREKRCTASRKTQRRRSIGLRSTPCPFMAASVTARSYSAHITAGPMVPGWPSISASTSSISPLAKGWARAWGRCARSLTCSTTHGANTATVSVPGAAWSCLTVSAWRVDELIGHGHSNPHQKGTLDEAAERALLQHCRTGMQTHSGQAPTGWLSPWISESFATPDLLLESGYRYTLNWCHDDQPTRMKTRNGQALWSIPYPQEVNDIPMIVARQMDGKDFAQLIIDNFDEMLEQSRKQPLVMGIALHPYLVGQPYRLRHLRRALQHT